MATKLYVGGLSHSTTSETLRGHFESCGTVVSSAVITDRETGQSRGFGFIEMSNQTEADAAISKLDQKEFDGKSLTVNVAKPRGDHGSRR